MFFRAFYGKTEKTVVFLKNKRLGRQTVAFTTPPAVAAGSCVVGQKEGEGPLRKWFDYISDDSYFGQSSWEKAESVMLSKCFALCCDKAKIPPSDIQYLFAGDLLNQNVALNKTSGGSFYRKSMQGGMCDVMAYKNDHGDQSYVSWANQDGSTYIFCIMQSPDTCDDYGYANRRPALCETTKLIDWVFDSFSIQAALDTDQALAEIPVKYSSDTDTLQLYPDDNMMTLLPSSGDGTVTQKYFHLPDYAAAPIHQGDVIGTVELKLAGETIGVVNLIAGQDVRQNALLFTVSKVQDFFHSLYLKVVIVMSLLALAIYGLWWLLNVWHGRRPTKKIHRR